MEGAPIYAKEGLEGFVKRLYALDDIKKFGYNSSILMKEVAWYAKHSVQRRPAEQLQ